MFQLGEMWQKATDRFTSALKAITLDHSYIHEGHGFRALWKSESIAAAATEVASITTPNNGKYVHMRPAIFASTANLLEVTIIEGAVVTGGTTVANVNQNRNSALTSAAVVKKGVTIGTPGTTTIGLYTVGSGGVPAAPKSGGSTGESNELVLKPNTTYSIALSNIGSVTATIAYASLFWYDTDTGV